MRRQRNPAMRGWIERGPLPSERCWNGKWIYTKTGAEKAAKVLRRTRADEIMQAYRHESHYHLGHQPDSAASHSRPPLRRPARVPAAFELEATE